MKKLFCILICLALFAACDNSSTDTGSGSKEFDGELGELSLIFGVMSDTHVGALALVSLTPEARLRKAYEKFTAINPSLDAIVTVGDFTDHGTDAEYETYKNIMDQYSTAKNNLLLMGNHDNNTSNGDTAVEQFKRFFDYEPTNDKVINGYHFITVSTRDRIYNTTSFSYHKEWLEGRLAAANAEDPRKPIFVFIHHTMAKAEVIGSLQAEAKGDGDLYDVFSKYPQVITFSGHSHVSTADPRNIWQGDYTSLNCGSVLYTALDWTHHLTQGKIVNALETGGEAIAPTNRGETSTALVVEVRGTKVTVRRIDNYWDVEIPHPFVFDTSVDKSKFPYREEKRIAESVPPEFAPGAAITIDKTYDNGIEFTFPQARTNNKTMPDDGAFTYEVSIKVSETNTEKDKFLLQANYFMLPRPETVTHNTQKLDANTSYVMSVIPVGYFGKKGSPLTLRFKTAEPGGGDRLKGYPILISTLTSALPGTGVSMDNFLRTLTGYNLNSVNELYGKPIFFKDEDLQEAYNGTDTIYLSTTIYSIIPLETLLTYI